MMKCLVCLKLLAGKDRGAGMFTEKLMFGCSANTSPSWNPKSDVLAYCQTLCGSLLGASYTSTLR